ncbi:hypothetical protein DMUE_5593, partial [Dictyocoela muelleri]
YFDFFTKNFYPNFLNLVKNIKIENNKMFYFDIDHFKKFYDLFNDFNCKTTHIFNFFIKKGKYNKCYSTLRSSIPNIKNANESFFKFYMELYNHLITKNNNHVLFKNEPYDEIKNKISELEHVISKITNLKYSMDYPKKIKTMLVSIDFQANILLSNTIIIKNKFNIHDFEDIYLDNRQISIFKQIYEMSINNYHIYKKLISQILQHFLANSTLLDRTLEISSMNDDLINYFYILNKDDDYKKIPEVCFEETMRKAELIIHIIIAKIDTIFHFNRYLKDTAKSDFNIIHKNLEAMLKYLEQTKANNFFS